MVISESYIQHSTTTFTLFLEVYLSNYSSSTFIVLKKTTNIHQNYNFATTKSPIYISELKLTKELSQNFHLFIYFPIPTSHNTPITKFSPLCPIKTTPISSNPHRSKNPTFLSNYKSMRKKPANILNT